MELEIDEMLVELIQNATQKALDKLFEEAQGKILLLFFDYNRRRVMSDNLGLVI